MLKIKTGFVIFLVFLFTVPAFAIKFYPDDPVRKDNDQKPSPEPINRKASYVNDLIKNTRYKDKNPLTPAVNINGLGEVPDSSWFTNRIGVRDLSRQELERGPNQLNGPESGTWTIVEAKSQGVSPGFTIQDSKGEVYFLKFDPIKYPQLSTSTEVIVTKFFHNFGYNVPENYIALLHPQQLQISPDAIITDENGLHRKMEKSDVNVILRKVPMKDGLVQVLASRKIPGELLGPFKFKGTRGDDANDIFSHEDRRELRGMRVFCAWLNHEESTAINTLDAYMGDAGKGYVKHYLIDFGSALGSDSIRPNDLRSGNEYEVEWGPIFKSAFSLGFMDRKWRSVHYPEYPSVGRFESQYFQPEKWKPDYPNPAFNRMLPDDAFWAAKIVMRFSDEMVAELVKTGQYENPGAEDYVTRTIIERRNKVVNYYLTLLPPLDDFRWNNDSLQFKNLGIDTKIGTINGYRYQWFKLNNDSEKVEPVGAPATVSNPSIPVTPTDGDYLMARIETVGSSIPGWNKKVDVYLRRIDRIVVGIERQ
jgi:hypothetical protein